ncbi:M24 family metallopeptidase [Fictibacillus phosphorivorans]|uniref:M24 family metallopeptidase n=1 Tax=Fictibacillus phosphorivorans TaxID=1221500 RepID=UPI001292D2FA|nr:M24 family metallopeptidase [Fictibacillus phosphorivorans]MQR96301.1 M24 family metallopeptidase [Fictibacillus phosphorivorans]
MTLRTEKNTVQILSLLEQEKIMDQWLFDRLEQLLPLLMKKHNVEMWITIGKEYNEDPIGKTFFPSAIDSSRRLTIFAFVKENHSDKINRYVISSNKTFEPFYSCYPLQVNEDPFDGLMRLIEKFNPESIAVNSSLHYAFCDGLSHSNYEKLQKVLGTQHAKKLVSSENIAIDWLQTRTESELHWYRKLEGITKEIVKQTFTNELVIPHKTSTQDLVRWIRQHVTDLGLKTSFYPTVDIQRQDGSSDRLESVILPGDIIHLDFGIEYLGLCTDTQQLAYVLKENEIEPPKGLRNALSTANEFEDLFFKESKEGMSGNEIFLNVLTKAKQNHMDAMLYSHPIGYFCHGAGPIIGLYDKQEYIPIRGELRMENNTCYALEFNIKHFIPEWNKAVPIYLEETVCFKEGKMQFFAGRQTEFYLIKPKW